MRKGFIAERKLIISLLKERLHQKRSSRVAMSSLNDTDSENPGDTDESMIQINITDNDST